MASGAKSYPLEKEKSHNYKGGDVHFQWNLRVQWEGDDGRKFDDPFPGETQASNSDTSSWTINWNDIIRGGDEITLDVTATAGGKRYDKTINHSIKIVGLNPLKEQQKNELSIQEQVIVYIESRWRQFRNDRDYPIWGEPHGYGLMQLDTPRPTDEQVWNWKENLNEGCSRFGDRKTNAAGYPSRIRKRGGRYANAPDFTSEQLLTDAYQQYNGHHYWIWITKDRLKPSTSGNWQKDPRLKRDYGGVAIKIYNNVVNNNPPSDW